MLLPGLPDAFSRLNSPSSQPVLKGEVFHPLGHFCGPALVAFHQVHVSPVLRTPHLDAILQLRSHQCRVEAWDNLPQSWTACCVPVPSSPFWHSSCALVSDTSSVSSQMHMYFYCHPTDIPCLLTHPHGPLYPCVSLLICRAEVSPASQA